MKRRMRIFLTDFEKWVDAFLYSIIFIVMMNNFLDKELTKILISWSLFMTTYMLFASFIAVLFPKKNKNRNNFREAYRTKKCKN